jgi:hypothetical protein
MDDNVQPDKPIGTSCRQGAHKVKRPARATIRPLGQITYLQDEYDFSPTASFQTRHCPTAEARDALSERTLSSCQ